MQGRGVCHTLIFKIRVVVAGCPSLRESSTRAHIEGHVRGTPAHTRRVRS